MLAKINNPKYIIDLLFLLISFSFLSFSSSLFITLIFYYFLKAVFFDPEENCHLTVLHFITPGLSSCRLRHRSLWL